jgi:hypothetical protein
VRGGPLLEVRDPVVVGNAIEQRGGLAELIGRGHR